MRIVVLVFGENCHFLDIWLMKVNDGKQYHQNRCLGNVCTRNFSLENRKSARGSL